MQPDAGGGAFGAQFADVPGAHDGGGDDRLGAAFAAHGGHLVAHRCPGRRARVRQFAGAGGTEAAPGQRRATAVDEQQPLDPVGHRCAHRRRRPPAQLHRAVRAGGGGEVARWWQGQRGQGRQGLPVVGGAGEHGDQGRLLVLGGQATGGLDPAADDGGGGDEFAEDLAGGAAVGAGHVGGLGGKPAGVGEGRVGAAGGAGLDQGTPAGVGGAEGGGQPGAEFLRGAGDRAADGDQHRTRGGEQLTSGSRLAALEGPAYRGQRLGGLLGLAQAVPAVPADHGGGLGEGAARRAGGVKVGVAVAAVLGRAGGLGTTAAGADDVVDDPADVHRGAEFPGDPEDDRLGLGRGQAAAGGQRRPDQSLEGDGGELAVEHDVLLDGGAQFVGGVGQQAHGVGGGVALDQPGPGQGEQVGGDRLLPVVRAAIVGGRGRGVRGAQPFG